MKSKMRLLIVFGYLSILNLILFSISQQRKWQLLNNIVVINSKIFLIITE